MKRIGLNLDILYFESSMIYRTSPIVDQFNEVSGLAPRPYTVTKYDCL